MLIILALLFYKLRPCSVEFVNNVELKIYVALGLVNAAGVMCYFLGVKWTAITLGVVMFLYVGYVVFAYLWKRQEENTITN